MTKPARSRSRSAARLAAVQALYQQEMEGTPVPRLLKEFHDHRLGATIEDAQYADAEQSFFDDVVSGVDARRDEIDAAISAKLAEGWSLDRLDKPMKAILRAGAYELLARADVPVASVISEYVDVAHAFYDKRESGFVNGLLDAIAKEARAARAGLMNEAEAIERLRRIATDPAARGLADDAALFDGLVITHDSIAEGVHFLAADPPTSVGWKLVAVNLSDLAAKGATPAAALLSLTISDDSDWDCSFPRRHRGCLRKLRPAVDRRRHDRTAGGRPARARNDRDRPRRADAPRREAARRPGDKLWLAGTVGDSAAGLAQLIADPKAAGPARRYLPAAGAVAQSRRSAGGARDGDDGRVGRTADRRPAARGRERRRPHDRPRHAAIVRFLHRRSRRRTWRRGCSRRPGATIMPCSPLCPPISTPD